MASGSSCRHSIETGRGQLTNASLTLIGSSHHSPRRIKTGRVDPIHLRAVGSRIVRLSHYQATLSGVVAKHVRCLTVRPSHPFPLHTSIVAFYCRAMTPQLLGRKCASTEYSKHSVLSALALVNCTCRKPPRTSTDATLYPRLRRIPATILRKATELSPSLL